MPFAKHGYPRPIILKDGSEIWLRPLDSAEDESRLLDFYQRLSAEDRWYLWHDVSDERVVKEGLLKYDPNLMLPIVALDQDQRIVGKATLYRYFPGARGHIARLRLILDPWLRNKRLGTYMLLDLVQLAVNMDLSLLVAEFIKGIEDRAIAAAGRLDFFEQSLIPAYARDPRGNTYDLCIMVKRLHGGYDDF